MGATPAGSVMTSSKPTNVCPSPWPLGSAVTFVKNSMRKFLLAVLLSVPAIVVVPAVVTADVSTGKFCRLLGPVSQSNCPTIGQGGGGSFCVTPSPPRSMPSPPLEKIELPSIDQPVVD